MKDQNRLLVVSILFHNSVDQLIYIFHTHSVNVIPCLRLLALAWPIFCFNLRNVRVAALDLGSGGLGSELARSGILLYTAIRYAEPFIITLQSSQYDLINIEEIQNHHHHYFKLNPHFLR